MIAPAASGPARPGLEHRPDDPTRLRQVLVAATVDERRAGGGAHESDQRPEGRGLAGAIGTQETRDPAGWRVKGEPVNGQHPAEAFG